MIPLHDDNPTELRPLLTLGLIAACVLVFFWQILLGSAQPLAITALGVIPGVLFGAAELSPELAIVPAPATLVTSMFLHGGLLHLAGNMLYLWIFGNNVEDAMGHARFIVFYLVCGIAAAFAQALPNPESTTPMIGASGAISGVLGAYLLLYPQAKVLVGIPLLFILYPVQLKAYWVLGLWFAVQFLSSLGEQGEAGVAWYAHLGGFVAGMVLAPFFLRRGVRLFNPSRESW